MCLYAERYAQGTPRASRRRGPSGSSACRTARVLISRPPIPPRERPDHTVFERTTASPLSIRAYNRVNNHPSSAASAAPGTYRTSPLVRCALPKRCVEARVGPWLNVRQNAVNDYINLWLPSRYRRAPRGEGRLVARCRRSGPDKQASRYVPYV